jgi:hypothetical protein
MASSEKGKLNKNSELKYQVGAYPSAILLDMLLAFLANIGLGW